MFQPPIVFLLGPSGSGKSTLAGWLATDLDLLHLEIDQAPCDGIDLADLRTEWNTFYIAGDSAILASTVRARAETETGRKRGVILSFPSNLVLGVNLIQGAEQQGIHSFVLYGTAADCLRAFLRREVTTGRCLDQEHWIINNRDSYIAYSRTEFAGYRLDTFTGGCHRPRADVVTEVRSRLTEPLRRPATPAVEGER